MTSRRIHEILSRQPAGASRCRGLLSTKAQGEGPRRNCSAACAINGTGFVDGCRRRFHWGFMSLTRNCKHDFQPSPNLFQCGAWRMWPDFRQIVALRRRSQPVPVTAGLLPFAKSRKAMASGPKCPIEEQEALKMDNQRSLDSQSVCMILHATLDQLQPFKNSLRTDFW